jgi:CTD small phosphatase-like protein 2
LDLDETLVHYFDGENEGHFLVRPGCKDFLITLSEYFEIVIFTAAMQDYADWVLDHLDPDHSLISYRLYRQHTYQQGLVNIKDLGILGRDLSRTVIVDNVAENFRL